MAAFSSIRKVLCDSGFFAEGDTNIGIYLRYWGNGRLRELKTFQNGVTHGFAVDAHAATSEPQFSHFKEGRVFGEATSNLNTGRVREHLLMDGEAKIPFSEDAATGFQGFLTTDEEEELFRKYARYPSREAFIDL